MSRVVNEEEMVKIKIKVEKLILKGEKTMKEKFIEEKIEKEKKPTFEIVQIDLRKPLEEQPYDFGIEITLPEAKNDLDHHGPEATAETPSACEQALELEEEKLPPEGARIAILRPDADSLTALAILKSRKENRKIDSELVKGIGILDRLGPKSMEEFKGTSLEKKVAAIWKISGDFTVPLEKKVEFIQKVLEGDKETEQEVERLYQERNQELEKAKETSEIKLVAEGKIAFVKSKDRYAMNLGYEKANIVIALNPEMPIMERTPDGKFKPTGQSYRKYTIARLNQFVPVDLAGALKELNQKEKEKGGKPTWGGRGDIIGSPIGVSSKLEPEEVVEIVEKYLIK